MSNTIPTMQLSGTIEKVHSQMSNGWFSVKIRLSDESLRKRNLRQYITNTSVIKCTGYCDFTLHENLVCDFSVSGLTTDPKWGMQFHIDAHTIFAKPANAESVWAYLKCLNTPDVTLITKTQVIRLYDAYGENIFNAIRKNPISEIRKYCSHADDLKMFVIENDLMTGLLSIHDDMTPQVCRKAIEKFGSKAYQKITADPYILNRKLNFDIHKTDNIACRLLNLGFNSPERKHAALVSAVNSLCIEHSGSFIVFCDDSVRSLIRLMNEMLLWYKGQVFGAAWGIKDTQETRDRIITLINENEDLQLVRYGRQTFIYLKHMYEYECDTAETIGKRVKKKTHLTKRDIIKAVDDYKQQFFQQMDDQQYNAVVNAFKHSISVINGGAGTGKSSIIDAIVRCNSELGFKAPLILTPTHKAKKRIVEILTANDSLDLLLDKDGYHRIMTTSLFIYKSALAENGGYIPDVKKRLVIIDESSMTSLDDASLLVQLLQKAFSVVFIGDYNQLPSIKPGQFFKDLCNCDAVARTELLNCYRQNGGKVIVENSHKINQGNAALEYKADMFEFDKQDYDVYADIMAKEYADLVSQGVAMSEICCLSPVSKENYKTGTKAINQKIQDRLNPLMQAGTMNGVISFGEVTFSLDYGHKGYCIYSKDSKSLRIGDRVVCEENLPHQFGVNNGDVGMIISFSHPDEKNGENKNEATMTVRFDNGDEKEIPKRYIRSFSLGYCLTIHKSQGSEYNYVLISVPNDYRLKVMMSRNLIYTAVTRAKKYVKIYGSEAMLISSIQTPLAVRNSMLHKRIEDASV